MYKRERASFLPKYQALLKASTTHSVKDRARIAGFDLSDSTFWETSFQSITKQIDMFLSLAQQHKYEHLSFNEPLRDSSIPLFICDGFETLDIVQYISINDIDVLKNYKEGNNNK